MIFVLVNPITRTKLPKINVILPSRLCLEESKVFRFFIVIFSHILTCLARDSGTKVRAQTGHGSSGRGPEGSGGTGAIGWVGTGGDGGGPARLGGGVLSNGRNDSWLTDFASPAGSGDDDLERFLEWRCRFSEMTRTRRQKNISYCNPKLLIINWSKMATVKIWY
jgi:hypothetical protein